MIGAFVDLIKILNSEKKPSQISLAICFGMVMGLTPLLSLHNLLVLLFVLTLRVHLGSFLLAWPLFTAVAYLLDPLFHSIGNSILSTQGLVGTWTGFYNTILGRLSNFNNTIVMGSLTFCLIAFLPLFFLSNFLIRRYRQHLLAWMEKTWIVRTLKASKLFTLYQSVAD